MIVFNIRLRTSHGVAGGQAGAPRGGLQLLRLRGDPLHRAGEAGAAGTGEYPHNTHL